MATFDHTFANLRTLFGAFRYFRHGWGRTQDHKTWLHSVQNQTLQPPDSVSTPVTCKRLFKNTDFFQLLTFKSPAAGYLPSESATVRALYVAPRRNLEELETGETKRPLALLLPATGDHGFTRRLVTHALMLRLHGVASVIPESPFYGRRRPAGQFGALLRHVQDLPDLGRATIEESHVLLSHFQRAGFGPLVASGISQGGLHAAMVASLAPWRVHVVAAFAPHSAVPVFTDGVLGNLVDWGALGNDARDRMAQILDVSDIRHFAPVAPPNATEILLFAKQDRYVSHKSVDVWKATRPDMHVRWVRGGHVTGAMFRFPYITQAILEVISCDCC